MKIAIRGTASRIRPLSIASATNSARTSMTGTWMTRNSAIRADALTEAGVLRARA